MTDEESEQNDANSDEGVVFANTNYRLLAGLLTTPSMMVQLICTTSWSLFMSNGAKVKDMARTQAIEQNFPACLEVSSLYQDMVGELLRMPFVHYKRRHNESSMTTLKTLLPTTRKKMRVNKKWKLWLQGTMEYCAIAEKPRIRTSACSPRICRRTVPTASIY